MKKIIQTFFALVVGLLVLPSISLAGSQTYTNGAGGWVTIPAGVTRVTFVAQGGAGGNCNAGSHGGGGGAFASTVATFSSAPIIAVGGGGGGGYCLSGGAGGTTASGNGAGIGGVGSSPFGGYSGANGSVGAGGAGGNISDGTTVYYYGGAGGASGAGGGTGQGALYNYFCGNPAGAYGPAAYGATGLSGGDASAPSAEVVAGGGGGGYGGGGGGAGYKGTVDCAGTLVYYRGGGGGGGSYSHPSLSAPSPSGRSILLSAIGNPSQIYLGTGLGGLTPFSGVRASGGTITMSWSDPGTVNVTSNIAASWTITGPMTITGSGTSQSAPAAPGTYTITWGAVSGYTTPAPQSLTLASLGSIAFAGNYTPSNTAPIAPTVSGPTSSAINTSQTYSFIATDPQNNQIRYGVDWDMNGVADVWVPAGVTYVNSGTSQSTTYSWATSGVKTFQVLAQDVWGLNSPWASYSVTIATPTCANETNNYPLCTQCPDNQAFLSTHCVYCSGTGGCTGVPGGTVANPNGSLVCNNGALTPPYCNDCATGMYYTGTSCIACSNGGCSGVGAGLVCNNGNIDPPTCITPAPPSCNNDTVCGTGETFLTCPSDCRTKYQQF